VLSVEDVHWIDPTTSELLERLIARVPRTHILLLVTFRPEFTPPWPESSSTA
jgi:predicted ATPase